MKEYQQFFDNYFRENYKRFSFIAANQIKRFGIRGDIIELQSDVAMSVVTKFLNRYENDIIGLKELIDSNKLDGYLITSIRNYVSDLRDKQNNDPIAKQISKFEDDSDDPKEEININKSSSPYYEKEVNTQSPEKINENKQIYEILINELDEESVNIWTFVGIGYSFLEISKKLNINHNTIRTKWTAIRLKADIIMKREKKSNEV